MKDTVQSQPMKRIITFTAALLIALSLSFVLGACSTQGSNQGKSTEDSTQSAGNATFKLDTSAVDGGGVREESLGLKKGETPVTMLDHVGLSYEVRSSEYGNYVFSIDGIEQGEHGETSGWLYYVNGEFADNAADKYEVKDGDAISWVYSTGEESAE